MSLGVARTNDLFGRIAGGADRIVIIDCETTGLYNADRIVEIAAVTIGLDGEIHDMFDTLVQPLRDVSATDIHHITAEMVAKAPTFEQIAPDLALRLDGACLCAHNLPFDARMIANEFARVGSEAVIPAGLDTLALTRQRLVHACAMFGIEHDYQHCALGDAVATAQLLCHVVGEQTPPGAPAAFGNLGPRLGKVLRRGEVELSVSAETPLILQLAARMEHRGVSTAMLSYLDVLDRAIADLHLDRDERAELATVARTLGLTDAQRQQAHRRYLNQLIDLVLADHVVDDEEYEALLRIGTAFDIDRVIVEQRTHNHRGRLDTKTLTGDERVVITGEHPKLSRPEIEALFRERGWRVQPRVRSDTTLVTVADPATMSGKARTARQRAIPIAVLSDVLDAQPGGEVACEVVNGFIVITCPDCFTNWVEPYRLRAHRTRLCDDCMTS